MVIRSLVCGSLLTLVGCTVSQWELEAAVDLLPRWVLYAVGVAHGIIVCHYLPQLVERGARWWRVRSE